MNRVDLAKVKQFLKLPEVQDALKIDDLDTVYTYALNPANDADVSYLTEFFLGNGIDPLQYVTRVHKDSFLGVHLVDYGIEQLTVPSHIKRIEEYGFYDCSGLESIVIENGCTSISVGAFAYCQASKIYIPESVTTINDNAFRFCDKATIYCKEGSYAHGYCEHLQLKYELI